MSKSIITFFAMIFLFFTNSFAQTSPAGTDLYARALQACLVKELEDFGKFDASRVDYKNRVVEQNIFLTQKLPTQFDGIKVEYLDSNTLRERFTKTRKAIQVITLRPMKNEGSTLRVSTGNYWFSYKKNSYNYALEGGCNVDFNFDGSKQDFVITKIDLWGI